MSWNFFVREARSGESAGTRSGWVFRAARLYASRICCWVAVGETSSAASEGCQLEDTMGHGGGGGRTVIRVRGSHNGRYLEMKVLMPFFEIYMRFREGC